MNNDKPSDGFLTHLKHLFPKPVTVLSPRAMGKSVDIDVCHRIVEDPQPTFEIIKGRPWLDNQTFGNDYICYNPLSGRYDWRHPYAKSVTRHIGRTTLWESMFGRPSGDVWDRFVRAFHHWEPDFVKLGRRLRPIEPYLAMDWLTNVITPRVNQYDPVNYIEYCEKHLKYNPVLKSKWVRDLETFNMDPRWWAPSLINPFKNYLYGIDDNCKEILAQMFPIKPLAKKRII